MKVRLWHAPLLLFVVLCSGALQRIQAQEGTAEKDGNLTVTYIGGNGETFQLFCTHNGDVTLYTKMGVTRDATLEKLRVEVIRLTKERDQSIRLGNSGMYFKFGEGSPGWGPLRNGEYQTLYFARWGDRRGPLLKAEGFDLKGGFDGYKDWKPEATPEVRPEATPIP